MLNIMETFNFIIIPFSQTFWERYFLMFSETNSEKCSMNDG